MIILKCDICSKEVDQDDREMAKFAFAEKNYSLQNSVPQSVGFQAKEMLFCGECKEDIIKHIEERTKNYAIQ